MIERSVELISAADTQKLAACLAASVTSGVVYLVGDLGAGKTTLVRFWLESLGVTSRIKSPTYTLVEEYQVDLTSVYHLDLYRLESGEDYMDLGLDDLPEGALMLIEWPDKASGFIPKPDLVIEIGFTPAVGEEGRVIGFTGPKAGSVTLDQL